MATKTPDLSEFYRLSRPKKPPCQIGFIIDQLDADDADKLKAALSTDGGIITANAIVEWVGARGHETNAVRVTNHLRGVCTCGKS